VDVERDSSAVPAGAAALGFASPEGGGFGIALDDPNLIQVGAAVPAANWPGPRPCWRVETVSGASGKAARRSVKEPLTIERLAAWAERLRGSEKPAVAASEAPAAEVGRGARPRAIRAVDVVAVRRIAQPAETTAPTPLIPRPELTIQRGGFGIGGIPSSPGMRFVLLCLAGFFLSAGGVHSYLRWKQTRVIVIPVSINPDSMIT
jgi:hypothetical protein